MTEPLPSQRRLFDLPDHVAYLNAANLGPLPIAAAEAGRTGLYRKLRPWSLTSDAFFADTKSLRPKLATLINADPEGIAFAPSASYGLATAARNLPVGEGQTILTLADQFPSNVYAWRALAARAGASVRACEAVGNASLSDSLWAAIDETTAIVATPQVRWTDGAWIDLEAVRARCDTVGAALVVDVSQSCGAMNFDVRRVRPDFLVCVGYKWLLGPYAAGFFYVAPEWRNGEPLEQTWMGRRGSENFERLIDYTDAFSPGAERFDAGERSNFALLPALEACVDLVLGWGVDRVEATLCEYNRRLAARLAEIGLAPLDETVRGPHYLTAALPKDAPDDLLQQLAARDVHVSRRGARLRITPHVYNTTEDADRLIDALRELLGR